MTLDRIEKKLKDLVKLQSYYFSKGNAARCTSIGQEIDDWMKKRELLLDEEYANEKTETNWWYDEEVDGGSAGMLME